MINIHIVNWLVCRSVTLSVHFTTVYFFQTVFVEESLNTESVTKQVEMTKPCEQKALPTGGTELPLREN